ncbi:Cerato-platanin [Niveomyces insectorum RCEF 264]|uniref:Cerato-platanin n=1 Tax=Niveomyces insectorum RCEF 264 TaxID=1081102 RepID=A0A167ST79_9HYPO|nr:Cerato-platanin [Niveomyces insectorum RCEF 264]
MRLVSAAPALFAVCLRVAAAAASQTVWVTPHDSYSSSIGVLGCKINTNRVAYWPSSVDCNNICVSLSYGGRSVYLLRIDQSGGAHDVSYDAWNYLTTGKSATADPTAGGAVAMQTENVDASHCASLLSTPKSALPLSAPNSMNFLNSCLEQHQAGNDSWVAKNYVLYNILDTICTYGVNEACTLTNWPDQNQPACPHTLGDPVALRSQPVYNIAYPTGEKVLAGAPPSTAAASGSTANNAASASAACSFKWLPCQPVLFWAISVGALVHSVISNL